MKRAIVLCSGGLDSVTTSYYVKKKLGYKKIIILFFDYGQKSLKEEEKFSKNCAKEINAKFIEIKLNFLDKISKSLIDEKKIKKLTRKDLKNTREESKKWYFPCRNTVFLVNALTLAEFFGVKNKEVWDIFVGFKCEGKESYPDATEEFVREMNKLSQISCVGKFKIIAPLIKKDKEDIILLGKKLGVDLGKTYSCYIGTKSDKHCGYCLACRLRQEGFYWANIQDPTDYKERMKDFRIAKG